MPQLRQTKLPKTELISPQVAEQQGEQPEAPNPIRVTALIVSHNRASMLRRAIESLEKSEEREKLDILVVDNGSTDGSAQLEADFPNVRFIRIPRNFGLTKALNIGVRSVTSEFVLFLHEDTEVSPDTARVLAGILENQTDVGIACPLLVTEDRTPAPQVADLPAPASKEIAWRPAKSEAGEQAIHYSRGAALMVRKFFLTAMRQIDERYGTYGSDAELCFQAVRAGKRVLVVPSTAVLHHGRAALDAPARGARDADFLLGVAVYLRKRFGVIRGLLFRLAAVLRSLGGLLSFRDIRYHLALLGALVSGQKIDGTQQQ